MSTSTRERLSDYSSFICRVEDKTLFVPSARMNAVHKHSTKSAIAARAGFHTGTWVKFTTRHPEMLPWIYRSCHCRSRCNCGLPDGAEPTKAMADARKETSLQAIGRAANVSMRAITTWME